MKAPYVPLKLSECWDWLSPSEYRQLAFSALYAARRASRPPRRTPFLEQGIPWCRPADFVDTLVHALVLHVQTAAHVAGVPGYEFAPDRLAAFGVQFPLRADAPGVAGASPAGDALPVVAGRSEGGHGPSPHPRSEAITAPADPFLPDIGRNFQ